MARGRCFRGSFVSLPPLAGSRRAEPLIRVAWLILPVFAAGLAHVAALKAGALRALDRPLDGGRSWRGQPIFGRNKTWRGVFVMTLSSAVVMWLQAAAARRNPRVARVTAIDFARVPALQAGAVYGLGYVIGELPNSFVKRRLGLAPGARAPRLAGVQYAVDQLDSVVGCLIALRTFYRPTRSEVLGAALLGAGLHVAVDASLYVIGIKRRQR